MSELTDAEIDELSLFAVLLALRRLRNHCRKHLISQGHYDCPNCQLRRICRDYLPPSDTLAEFCTDAIQVLRESDDFRRREP